MAIEYQDKSIPLVLEWWRKFVEAGFADRYTDVHASVSDYDENQEFVIYGHSDDDMYLCNSVIHTGIRADVETYINLKTKEV